MSLEISVTPVIVSPVGNTVTERKLNVVYGMVNRDALMAVAANGGKVGKAAMSLVGQDAMLGIVARCCHADYRPLAEYIAATLGEAVVISGRSTFEALPDWFEQRIMKIRASKTGGMKVNADGLSVPSAKMATELTLKGFCVDAIAAVSRYHAERKARAEKDATDQQAALELAQQ